VSRKLTTAHERPVVLTGFLFIDLRPEQLNKPPPRQFSKVADSSRRDTVPADMFAMGLQASGLADSQ